MNITPKSAITAFLNSNFCFDGQAATTLVDMMGGDDRFAVIATKLVQDNYEMDMTWALINTKNKGFTGKSFHAISVIADSDSDNLRGEVVNAVVVSNSRTGLELSIAELTAFLSNDDNEEKTQYSLYWNILTEYGIKRICTDFCLYCKKHDIVMELTTQTATETA